MTTTRRVALFLLTVLLVVPPITALAGPGEGTLSSSVNSARAANGLDPLASHSTLVAHARKHSEEMLASNSIYHSTSAELKSLVSGYLKIGENVGRGPSASSVFDAFMGSSGHRAAILGDYTHMGVGTAEDPDGILYVTIVFMKLPGSTTTTTTQPPATTTTTTQPSSTSSTTTTTKPPTSTTQPSSTSSTTTTTTLADGISVAEAVGCALAGLGLDEPTATGSASVVVTSCEEAGTAANAWPRESGVTGSENGDGTITITFSHDAPDTTTTQPQPVATTTSTVAPDTGPTVPTTTPPTIDFTAPASPGAADLVRLVAGSVLGVSVALILVLLFRRRR